MLLSSISSSVSPTTLHCLLSRMCNALVSCMMMILLLFLQKQNLASAIYLFGLDTLMGGDCAWDHIDSCNRQSANWSIAHEHVLQALELICQAAGYATSRKRVLPSEGNSCADLEVCNIRVAGKTDLLVDFTLRHDFIGAGRSGHTQGQLLNPDNPDRILESASSDKIRTYRDPYQRNLQVAFLPACMSTSGRIHGEFLRLLFFLSNKPGKPTITLQLLVTRHTRRSFVTASVSSFTATGAPLCP